jgi:hypothetical protein
MNTENEIFFVLVAEGNVAHPRINTEQSFHQIKKLIYCNTACKVLSTRTIQQYVLYFQNTHQTLRFLTKVTSCTVKNYEIYTYLVHTID